MKQLKIVENGHFATVSLNRPEVRNAFGPEMIKELTTAFKDLNKKKDLRAICLKGEGKAFSAGGDLNWMKEMVSYNYDQNISDAKVLFEMFEAIHDCHVPIVGVAQGSVFGGGLGLLSGCDFVVAEEKTQFCFSEVKLGIAPAVISSFILKKISRSQVTPLMISGHVFGAQEALRMGLVHLVCEEESLADQAETAMNWFKSVGPEASRSTKKLLSKLDELNWAEKKEASTELIAELRVSKEGQEGLQAFLNKTKPRWRLD